MRVFAIAADVAMGVFLGLVLFAVLSRLWPGLASTGVGVVTVAAAVIVVLFRRPNGSLAVRDRRIPDR